MKLADIPANCPLPKDTPYGVQNVSYSQMSIARHYGGLTVNGRSYLYLPLTDELIREDVAKWLVKTVQQARRAATKPARQGSLL